MGNRLAAFLKNESGSTATEYGLLAAGIAIAIAASISTLGCSVSSLFTKVAQGLRSA